MSLGTSLSEKTKNKETKLGPTDSQELYYYIIFTLGQAIKNPLGWYFFSSSQLSGEGLIRPLEKS